MERKPLSFPISITVTGAVGGAGGSGNNATSSNSAISNAGGYIRQVIVDPPQDSATYDFRIANSSGRNVFKRTAIVGDFVEDIQTPLPAGTYTCYIENCSHNGNFQVEIIFCEVY